jgi:hypothetical protein
MVFCFIQNFIFGQQKISRFVRQKNKYSISKSFSPSPAVFLSDINDHVSLDHHFGLSTVIIIIINISFLYLDK